jgi:hypothetical protein
MKPPSPSDMYHGSVDFLRDHRKALLATLYTTLGVAALVGTVYENPYDPENQPIGSCVGDAIDYGQSAQTGTIEDVDVTVNKPTVGNPGRVEGVPRRPNSKLATLLTESTVKVLAGDDIVGTGFVVNNDKGQQRVITAAHVVAGTEPEDIHLLTPLGEDVYVRWGCFVSQTGQNLIDPGSDVSPPEVDEAVLEPLTNVSSKVLPIGELRPERGSTVTIGGYPADKVPLDTAIFNGIVATAGAKHDVNIITGVQPARERPVEEYTLVPGDSGSPVIQLIGEVPTVVGMATGRTPADGNLNSQQLEQYGVNTNVTVGGEGQLPLVFANATPPKALKVLITAGS